MAIALACLTALCLGLAIVTGKRGLRTLDARSGAAISIPTATLLFLIASPFMLEFSGATLAALVLFTALGALYPAAATLVTFISNDRLGPTVTSTLSGTAPLFALVCAAVILGESMTLRALAAALGVALGVGIISWAPHALTGRKAGWALLLPLSGAFMRGLAQTVAKAGLMLWPNPFGASVIGYVVSSATVLSVNRARSIPAARGTGAGKRWFALTGALNGFGLWCMYVALNRAPVTEIAPIVAAFPLVTTAAAALSGEEPVTWRMATGSVITVGAIILLVA
jgi:drug/metabolite transporter (DMT)-like permease